MKLFTEAIAEPKKYFVKATITVLLEIDANDEGEAGYLADQELELTNGYISHEISDIKDIKNTHLDTF